MPSSLRIGLVLVLALASGFLSAQADPLEFLTAGAYDTFVVQNVGTGSGASALSITGGGTGADITGSGTGLFNFVFGQTAGLVMTEYGFTNGGTSTGGFPLTWDISLGSDEAIDGPIQWQLYFGLGASGGPDNYFFGGYVPGGSTTEITGTFTAAPVTPLEYYVVTLSEWEYQDGIGEGPGYPPLNLSMNINSITIGETPSSVPEPAPAAVALTGIGMAFVRRRRSIRRN